MSREPPIWQYSSLIEWERGTLVWLQFSVTLIRPRWRPVMPFLLYANTTNHSQAWLWLRRYSNTSYIPWGMTPSLYLDMGIFSGGITSIQFPLDRLCLHCYILLAGLRCFYHAKWGKRGWRHTPISQSSYGMVQRRNTIFPIQSPCQPPCCLLCNWKRAPRLREGQTVILLVLR